MTVISIAAGIDAFKCGIICTHIINCINDIGAGLLE